jgi:hypothetical protein
MNKEQPYLPDTIHNQNQNFSRETTTDKLPHRSSIKATLPNHCRGCFRVQEQLVHLADILYLYLSSPREASKDRSRRK